MTLWWVALNGFILMHSVSPKMDFTFVLKN